jgi:hypothetical protein
VVIRAHQWNKNTLGILTHMKMTSLRAHKNLGFAIPKKSILGNLNNFVIMRECRRAA